VIDPKKAYKAIKKDLLVTLPKPMKVICKTILDELKKEKPTPVVITKGRGVGASHLMAAISLGIASLDAENKHFSAMNSHPNLSRASYYYKETVRDIINNAREGKRKSSIINNRRAGPTQGCTYVPFINGSLEIEGGLNACKLRGKTVHAVFFDEAQDHIKLEEAIEALKYQHQGVLKVFIVTPHEKDEHISKKLWENSTKNVFHLQCEHCNDRFTVNKDNIQEVLSEEDCYKCPSCSCFSDKEASADKGQFVTTAWGEEYIGFKIPMAIIPSIKNSQILKLVEEGRPTSDVFAEWREYEYKNRSPYKRACY